jgi:hypothetical protein
MRYYFISDYNLSFQLYNRNIKKVVLEIKKGGHQTALSSPLRGSFCPLVGEK